ncbi:hypothetical protein BDA99DRAFT_532968 [Phascolomyces articulosus]|uniref:Polyadenylate tail-binding protein n=1 Tax=Phascolomyces articulosus TaxID=60185 RepID=A0AAD5K832_9FUNG|nr:hypothetical protein BDA99DRAFT_532968 [Phascolomyces articulosus]
MTEIVSEKPIVRLPKKRESILLTDRTTSMVTTMKPPLVYRDALVSDRLYTEGIPSTVSENDILDLVQSCDPEEVQLNRMDGTGCIRFSSINKADRAYTLFNDATLKNQVSFRLKMLPPFSRHLHQRRRRHGSGTTSGSGSSSSGSSNNNSHPTNTMNDEEDYEEPVASSGIYQIRNLPLGTTNHILYDYFRPYGPMKLCKIIMDHHGKGFKGTALVQYFHIKDAEMAIKTMNNRIIQGNTINVFPFIPKKSRTHSSEGLMFLNQQPSHLSNTSTSPTKTLDGNNNINNNGSHGDNNNNSNGTNGAAAGEGGSVDYTNLYIKNLDLDVKSSDLFKHFRQYGRIISARVMKNPDTDKSKGFGFVSFGRAEEARWALEEMNNKCILSKPIIVAYHEPKKPRTEKNGRPHDMIRRFSTPGIPPHPPPPYMPVAPPISEYIDYSKPQQQQQQQQQPSPAPAPTTRRPPMTNHNTSPGAMAVVNEKFTNNNHNNNHTIKKRHYTMTHIPTTTTASKTPAIATATTNGTTHPNKPLFIPSPPLHQQQLQQPQQQPQQQQPHFQQYSNQGNHQQRPSHPQQQNHQHQQQQQQTKPPALIRRRSSNESVTSAMTETTPDLQKHRMTDAVIRVGVKNNVEDIVEMLLTLKRKERSLCLFNQNILREQIKLAKSALEICKDDDDEVNGLGTDSPPTPVVQLQQQQQPYQPPLPSSSLPPAFSMPFATQRVSRAIPIVAPPQPTPPPSAQMASNTPATDKLVKPTPNSIDQLLMSLEGLPLTQQKEKLGDRLFPYVKATGVKHAPKVTVRLLDTIPLDELARTMHDQVVLKTKVDVAVASLQQSQ